MPNAKTVTLIILVYNISIGSSQEIFSCYGIVIIRKYLNLIDFWLSISTLWYHIKSHKTVYHMIARVTTARSYRFVVFQR